MSKLTDLAELLEQAARALREADEALSRVPIEGRPLRSLPGYKALSVRARKCLWQQDASLELERITTVEQLCKQTVTHLMCRRNLGVGTLLEIKNWLAKNGLQLAQEAREDSP